MKATRKKERNKNSSAKKEIPRFSSESAEREFWASRDSADYLDWRKAVRLRFPNLKPSTRSISIRLPEWMVDALKVLANSRDVPYQSLLKVFLAEKLREELRKSGD